MSGEKRRFRVAVARMVFGTVEVEAISADQAELLGRDASVKWDFETLNFTHRTEERHPVPGKPGEFQWVEVRRGT